MKKKGIFTVFVGADADERGLCAACICNGRRKGEHL